MKSKMFRHFVWRKAVVSVLIQCVLITGLFTNQPVFAQNVSVHPRLLDQAAVYGRSAGGGGPQRVTFCGAANPSRNQVSAWMVNTTEGRYDFAAFDVRDCSGRRLIQVQVNPPGGNPRQPLKYWLSEDDVRELVSNPQGVYARGFFSDAWKWVKEKIDPIREAWGKVWDAWKRVRSDLKQLSKDAETLVNEAGNFLNVIAGKDANAAAVVANSELNVRMAMRQGAVMSPSRAWGQAMAQASQQHPNMARTILSALQESPLKQ